MMPMSGGSDVRIVEANPDRGKGSIELLRGGLIVSCQAPVDSPLNDPYVIGAFALCAQLNGAVGVRINGPAHIAAVKRRVLIPIIGIEKAVSEGSEVYITPTAASARAVSESGADIIACDATQRPRPGGERIETLIRYVHEGLGKPVMADIATVEEGIRAAESGADIVATTLCGYTSETAGVPAPSFELVERLSARLRIPVICEGGISTPEEARRAFDCGAFAIVTGAAITGVDHHVRRFVRGLTTAIAGDKRES